MRNTDDFLELNNSLVRDDQQAVSTTNSSRSNQKTPRMRQSQETLTPATVTLSVPELERIVRRDVSAQYPDPFLDEMQIKTWRKSDNFLLVDNFQQVWCDHK